MREVTITAFEAFDGKRFESAKECRDYESASGWRLLIGRTEDQILAAMNRNDPVLADVIENCGMEIGEMRKKAGVFRRKPSVRDSAANTEAKTKTNGARNAVEDHGPS